MNGILLPCLAAGTKLVTLPKFQPETFLDVFVKQKVKDFESTPNVTYVERRRNENYRSSTIDVTKAYLFLCF